VAGYVGGRGLGGALGEMPRRRGSVLLLARELLLAVGAPA
jgi:hypothetical protein